MCRQISYQHSCGCVHEFIVEPCSPLTYASPLYPDIPICRHYNYVTTPIRTEFYCFSCSWKIEDYSVGRLCFTEEAKAAHLEVVNRFRVGREKLEDLIRDIAIVYYRTSPTRRFMLGHFAPSRCEDLDLLLGEQPFSRSFWKELENVDTLTRQSIRKLPLPRAPRSEPWSADQRRELQRDILAAQEAQRLLSMAHRALHKIREVARSLRNFLESIVEHGEGDVRISMEDTWLAHESNSHGMFEWVKNLPETQKARASGQSLVSLVLRTFEPHEGIEGIRGDASAGELSGLPSSLTHPLPAPIDAYPCYSDLW
ncbi:hypothetical protein NA57DRAFT_51095 [Rhizodiscina lignyota]|uniref:Uncharacterized protein n=1 Tax=Rhizodiscina lignyota TaxID=1504668 RepID=A0A9P4IMH4_9PEZI|nr:hypothetical protein NA57DRAFT_51095 [Rhizodiscina lignyota]